MSGSKTTPVELETGFYILEISEDKKVSIKQMDQGEAGILAAYRVQRLLRRPNETRN